MGKKSNGKILKDCAYALALRDTMSEAEMVTKQVGAKVMRERLRDSKYLYRKVTSRFKTNLRHFKKQFKKTAHTEKHRLVQGLLTDAVKLTSEAVKLQKYLETTLGLAGD